MQNVSTMTSKTDSSNDGIQDIQKQLRDLPKGVSYYVKCVQRLRYKGEAITMFQGNKDKIAKTILFYSQNADSVSCAICNANCGKRDCDGRCPVECSKHLLEIEIKRK